MIDAPGAGGAVTTGGCAGRRGLSSGYDKISALVGTLHGGAGGAAPVVKISAGKWCRG